MAEIIEARTNEIFDMVGEELKKNGKAGLLPAGAVLVGGGAELPGIVELAKNKLGLPAKIGYPLNISGVLNEVDSPVFAAAVGLIKLWYKEERLSETKSPGRLKNFSKIGKIDMGDTGKKIKSWMDKFLP